MKNNDYITANISYWSLFPEILFYLLAHLLVLRPKIFLGSSFVLLIVGLFFQVESFDSLFLMFVFEYSFYFALGLWLYFAIDDKQEWLLWLTNKYAAYLLLSFLFVGVVFFGLLEIKPYSNIFAAFVSCLTILILLKYPIGNKWVNKVGFFLGEISYTLYLMHMPIYYLACVILQKYTGSYAYYSSIYWFIIPIAIGISYLVFLLIERKTLTVIQRLKRKKR